MIAGCRNLTEETTQGVLEATEKLINNDHN